MITGASPILANPQYGNTYLLTSYEPRYLRFHGHNNKVPLPRFPTKAQGRVSKQIKFLGCESHDPWWMTRKSTCARELGSSAVGLFRSAPMVSTFATIDPNLRASFSRRAMLLGLNNGLCKWTLSRSTWNAWPWCVPVSHALSKRETWSHISNYALQAYHSIFCLEQRGLTRKWSCKGILSILYPRTVFLLIASVANGSSTHAIKELWFEYLTMMTSIFSNLVWYRIHNLHSL